MRGFDTIVQCKKCGRKQRLRFADGLKSGWGMCCGYTMSIVYTEADIEEAVKEVIKEQIEGLSGNES